MLKNVFAAIIFLYAFSLNAQEDFGRNIVKQLCDSAFHGRGYVYHGDKIAAEFLVEEFKKLGVKGFKKNKYQQKFNLSVNTFPDEMSCLIDSKTLVPGVDFIANAGSASIEAELNPFVIDQELLENNEKLLAALRNVLEKKTNNAFVLDFSGIPKDSLKNYSGIGSELSELLPVIEISDSKFTWTVANQQLSNAYIYIQRSAIEALDQSVYKLKIDAKLIENYQSQNVIAFIKGKSKCDKTIVFTAHYDHLGRMGKETYFPGGNDNASGTAMLLNMAKYYKENPVDFNVMFIAFGGEEAGLIGSKHYTENPLYPLEKMSFLINLDIMGSGEEGITVVNATLFEKEFEVLKKINEEKELLTLVKSRGPAANSDHYFFTLKKVPAFFIYTMGPNKNYHDVEDNYENLSFNEFTDLQTLLIQFAASVGK